jgi:ABC-2 type transport system permease protein
LLKGFGNVFVKEIKELVRDPKILLGMIVIPLLLFPVLGLVLGFSMQTAKEQAAKAVLVVVNNDGGNWSERFIQSLNSSLKVATFTNKTAQQVLDQGILTKYNATQFLEIPKGFTQNLTEHFNVNSSIVGNVNSYGVFTGSSAFGAVSSTVLDAVVNQFNRQGAPDFVDVAKSSVVKGTIFPGVDPSLLSSIMFSQAIAMPVTVMILLTYSMSVAATSVAMEKEEKTLETLLTLPVDRFAILMGKLSGSILVAGVGALAYMLGFNYYLGSLSTGLPTGTLNLTQMGLVPTYFGYALLAVSLFVTLLSALALAVIMSAFAEDVRGAQSLVGYIYTLVFIPALVLMFVDVNILPLPAQIIIYAIPYSQPIIASKAIIIGDYVTPILGIVYVAAFTLVIMYVASRLFATERILTAKLKLRGLRRRSQKPVEDMA